MYFRKFEIFINKNKIYVLVELKTDEQIHPRGTLLSCMFVVESQAKEKPLLGLEFGCGIR